jgi:hypothetical protein
MIDTDSYLLKCSLELMEKDASAKDVLQQCEIKMGFVNYSSDNNKSLNNKGDK